MEILFIVLLVLAFPVIAIVGLVIAVGVRGRVATLETKFAALQQGLATAPRAAAGAGAGAAAAGAAAAAPFPVAEAAPAYPPPPEAADQPQPAEPAPQVAEPPRAPQPESLPEEPLLPAEPVTSDEAVPPRAAAGAGSVPPIAPPPPPPPPSQPAEPVMGFEERLGTQWTVWVGGVALALGGFFLVRYSIEQGWFGPGMRIFLGALLALALILAGEWARRKENLSDIAQLPAAHIPSILTAAGTAVAYADIYAAYALYEFIGAGTAFVLLGIVALGTLAAALVHGPALAGLGLVGAYVTPLIVSTGQPNYWALYIYLAVVTAAAFVLARARLWRWLAFTAVAFGLFWTLPGLGVLPVIGVAAHSFHVVVGFALVAIFIVPGLLFGPDASDSTIDPVSSVTLAAYLFGATLIVLFSLHSNMALTVFTALVVATVAIVWRAEMAAGALPLAALMVALVFLHFAVNYNFDNLAMLTNVAGTIDPDSPRAVYTKHLLLGAAFAALFGGAGYFAQGRSQRSDVPTLWAACAVGVPLAILVRSTTASIISNRRCRLRGSPCCSPRCSRLPPNCSAVANRDLAAPLPPRSSPPAQLPRSRSRSPSRWKRAGSRLRSH